MNYAEAVKYMEKDCGPGINYGLERIVELLARLGNPEKKIKLIHIAGTNGKGSVSRMLQSVLTNAGYKTAIFNSPFLAKPTEYLCIDGIDATEEEYAAEADIIRSFVDGSESLEPMSDRPTEFELSFAAAIDYFCRNECDLAIIECGLGGLSDATNCIPAPELAIITNIGIDHIKFLGDSLKSIAIQKSGIIKPGSSVVAYPSEREALDVIIDKCLETGCRLWIAGEITDDYKLGLAGEYQKRNAGLVLRAVEMLRLKGYEIDDRAISLGLEKVVWPARFEKLTEEPTVIIDGGHNMQCIDALCENLAKLQIKNALFVIGVMADKDYTAMFEKLKNFAGYVITTEPANSRRLDCKESCALWESLTVKAEAIVKPSEAVKRAFEVFGENNSSDTKEGSEKPYDAIIVTGSLYMMSEVRNTILSQTRDRFACHSL